MQEVKQEKALLHVHDVCELLGINVGLAYKVIRDCNEELASMGKLTLRGKVNRKYLLKKLELD